MTTWNAMTVAGIVLITGGVAILVVFRRQLWGSGGRRPGRAATAKTATTSRKSPPRVAPRSATRVPVGSPAGPASYGLASIGLADDDDDHDHDDLPGDDLDPADHLDPADDLDPADPARDAAEYDVDLDPDGLADRDLADHELADHELADHELADHELADHELAGLGPAEHDGTEPDETDAERVVLVAAPPGAEQARQPSGARSARAGSPRTEPPAAEPSAKPEGAVTGLTRSGAAAPASATGTPAAPALVPIVVPADSRSSGARPANSGPAAGGDRERAARSAGYRYADRVDGWVRPDYPERPAEPVPSGQYWLPVADPYADAGYGSPLTGDRTAGPDRVSAPWPDPVNRYERRRRHQPRQSAWDPEPAPYEGAGYDVAPAVEPMPAPSFDAAAAFAAARVPVSEAADHRHPTASAGGRYAPATARSGYLSPAGPGPAEMSAEPSAAPFEDADPHADRSGQHFPRRRRAATVRRAPGRTDAPPPAEQPIRSRVTLPRGETRRRIAASTEFVPTAPETTQMLPSVPVIEGYGGGDAARLDGVRVRDPEVGRPRPRPRPRPSGSTQGEDRQPSRSTVYVSRHAAEPS